MHIAHAADIHLGHRQYGLKQREADTRLSFQHFLSQARERDTDAILIPGDLFDSRDIRPRTLQHAFAIAVLQALREVVLDMQSVDPYFEDIRSGREQPPETGD